MKFHVSLEPADTLSISLLQLVSVNFWALNSLFDPALIDDTHAYEDFVPSWMNHSLHSYVLVFALAELLLSCRTYPGWTALGRLRSTVVVLAYASWWVANSGAFARFCSVFYHHNRWLGILTVPTFETRVRTHVALRVKFPLLLADFK